MTKVLRGVVHGKTIEVTEDLGMRDGQAVDLIVTIASSGEPAAQGIGLQRLADNLHRLAAHADFIRQDLRLFAFDHTSHQQDDLLRLQVSSFKDGLAVHIEGLLTHATPIVRHLTTFGYSKSALVQNSLHNADTTARADESNPTTTRNCSGSTATPRWETQSA